MTRGIKFGGVAVVNGRYRKLSWTQQRPSWQDAAISKPVPLVSQSRQPSNGRNKLNPGDQRHDYGAVFNVVSSSEGIVPMIEEFRDMAPETEGKDDRSSEL